jgi:hypothetical protein
MRKLRSAKTLAGAAIAVALASSIVSVPAADYGQFASRMQAKLAAELPRLSLSREQKGAFERIVGASIDRRVEILKRHGVDPTGKNPPATLQLVLPEIQVTNVELRADLAKILSEDQLKTFDAIADKLRGEMITALGGG